MELCLTNAKSWGTRFSSASDHWWVLFDGFSWSDLWINFILARQQTAISRTQGILGNQFVHKFTQHELNGWIKLCREALSTGNVFAYKRSVVIAGVLVILNVLRLHRTLDQPCSSSLIQSVFQPLSYQSRISLWSKLSWNPFPTNDCNGNSACLKRVYLHFIKIILWNPFRVHYSSHLKASFNDFDRLRRKSFKLNLIFKFLIGTNELENICSTRLSTERIVCSIEPKKSSIEHFSYF